MNRRTASRVGVALAGLLAASAAGAGEKPPRPWDVNQFRDHFIKEEAPEPKNGSVRVTFLGTTTLLFDDGETQLMTDGFLTRPPLRKFLKGVIETDPKAVDAALKRAKVERLKAVFVAHTHYDHALDVAYVCQKTKAKLYGSSSALNVGRGGDLKDEQMALFEAGKEYAVGQFKVTVLKGKHSPPIKGINDDEGQTIDKPLKQPAHYRDYKEGGAFDFLVKHGDNAILVNPSANYIEGSRDKIRAEVAFLAAGALDSQSKEFQNAFYDQTVKKVRPRLVIPIHWDNFFQPLSDRLEGQGDLSVSFDFLARRLKDDNIRFGILQGYQSITLFGPAPKK
jgi:L-ascorbate metabolism protein UlaG (beta-lactamase superfamily)